MTHERSVAVEDRKEQQRPPFPIDYELTPPDQLADLDLPEETTPPVIERLEVFPYPDLTRVWVRMQLSYFNRLPNLELYLYDPDGQLLSDMLLVEHRNFYVDVTLHLRASPRPGERYRLEVFLIRDDGVLDHKVHEFDLTFVDPRTGTPSDPTATRDTP